MPNPTLTDLHIDGPLTDLSVLFSNELTNTVHEKVFPVVPVQKRSDQFFTYDVSDWFRSEAKERAPGAEIAIGGWNLSTDSYFCRRDGIGHDISDPERANADTAVANLDSDSVRWITEQLSLKAEKDWVTAYFTTSVWDGASSTDDMTGSAAPASTAAGFVFWSDNISTPIEDVRGEMTAVSKRTGRVPNTLVLGAEVWTALADHPDILDRIKHTQKGIVTTDLFASLLDLDRVLVSNMVEDSSAVEGSSSVNMEFVAGKNALLVYVPPAPGLRTVSGGYTFSWVGMPGAPQGGSGARIKRYRLERNESDRIEGEHWKDFKVIGSSLGAFFATAVS